MLSPGHIMLALTLVGNTSEFCVFMPSIQINGEYEVHLALRSTQQERASDQLRGAGLDGETL